MNIYIITIISIILSLSALAENIKSGEYSVTQSWSQESEYKRPYHVVVPESGDKKKLPVFIALHGNGGNAQGMMNGYLRRYKSIAQNHIMVFPQGYQKSWNIVSERAKSNDLAFIESIVTTLISFDNVQKDNVTVLGSSNGAALVNQIAIETKMSNFKNYISLVSHLNTFQHDGKNFKVRGEDNNYKEIAQPLKGKRLLNVSGTTDPLVPYKGGPSKGIPAKDGKLAFTDAEESIFLWAKQFGYNGKKLSKATSSEEKLEFFEYLDGQAIHIKVNDAGHNAGGALNEKLLLKFLNTK